MKIKGINMSKHKLPGYTIDASGSTILNSTMTIKSDFHQEARIIPVNLSNKKFVIQHGERICQMVIC